jgi:hypothetical protein
VEEGEVFCTGKKLTVEMTFNYIKEDGQAVALAKKVGKKGSESATRRMFAVRAAEFDAE